MKSVKNFIADVKLSGYCSHTCGPATGIFAVLRIQIRQNLLPELYRTEFSVKNSYL